jgi:Uma2 family endonuclease
MCYTTSDINRAEKGVAHMVTIAKTTSLEEFLALPDDGNRHEFVRGEVRVMPPPKGAHGRIEVAVLAAIDRYLEEKAVALGWEAEQGPDAHSRLVGFVAGGEFGMQFSLPDDPNQIRGADGAYVTAEQYIQAEWDEESYFPVVPALVIEVISQSERAEDVDEKVQDYLAGGAQRVWCIYPRLRRVHIYDKAAPTQVLRRGDHLTDEELLPGFRFPLSRIFPPK